MSMYLRPRHALDIREHYERKLERANNLYMELNAIMLQLEIKEKELLKYGNTLICTSMQSNRQIVVIDQGKLEQYDALKS